MQKHVERYTHKLKQTYYIPHSFTIGKRRAQYTQTHPQTTTKNTHTHTELQNVPEWDLAVIQVTNPFPRRWPACKSDHWALLSIHWKIHMHISASLDGSRFRLSFSHLLFSFALISQLFSCTFFLLFALLLLVDFSLCAFFNLNVCGDFTDVELFIEYVKMSIKHCIILWHY